MQDPNIRHSFVQLNGSFVHLVQYGFGESIIKSGSLSDNYPSSSPNLSKSSRSNSISSKKNETYSPPCKRLIILLPGNPGVLGIYHDFIKAFYRIISPPSNKSPDLQPTILAIGHNDFDHPDHVDYRADERICIEEDDLNFVERALARNYRNEPYHIELQVLNKLIIIKRLLKINLEDCKLVFIGHSIGCHIILRLLQDRLVADAHEGSIFLHPALENVGTTEKGSIFNRLFSYKLDLLMKSTALMFDTFLPRSAKLAITKWFLSQKFVDDSSEMVLESVAQLACPKTLVALIEMAKCEFATIRDLNIDLMIKPHVSKLKLVYALNDHWVHTDHRRKMKQVYPDLYIEEQANLHAFVMSPETVMDYAVKVGMFVQEFADNIDHEISSFMA